MPLKSEVLNTIVKEHYPRKEVIALVASVKSGVKTAPEYFKKGDVFYMGVGAKRRPAVIIKVKGDIVFAIPVTNEDGPYALLEFNTRFLGIGYLTNQLITAPIYYVKDNFLGVFDNNKVLNIGIRKLKTLISTVL